MDETVASVDEASSAKKAEEELSQSFYERYLIVPPPIALRNVARMDLTLKQKVLLLQDLRELAQLALDHILEERAKKARDGEGEVG